VSESFAEKLAAAVGRTSAHALVVAPQIGSLPAELQRTDDPFLPYMRLIVAGTADLVCAYIFDLPSYLGLGGAGAVALERCIATVSGTHITVIDGRFSHAGYTTLLNPGSFGADAIIVSAGLAAAVHVDSDRAVYFVSDDTSVSPRYSPSGEMVGFGSMVRLLPTDTLIRARSLEFSRTLRSLVTSYVRS
jgi:hypothetical protein